MRYNYAAESFHIKKLCSRLSAGKAQFFIRKTKKIDFEAIGPGLGSTYAVRLRLIGKLVVDFLLVIIEFFFFARCFRFVTIHAFDRQTNGRNGRTDGQTDRQMLIGRPWLLSCSVVKSNQT